MALPPNTRRVLSLCSGIGGLDLGLPFRSRTVAYVEREAFAVATLIARMQDGSLAPGAIWDDIQSFDGSAWRGVVDCVVAGYPCQPFAQGGLRRGADDERYLWPHVARIIQECEAPVVFLENVSGHLNRGLREVVGRLDAMGYRTAGGLYGAEEVGASQGRERVFVLAYRGRTGREILCQAHDDNRRDASGYNASRCTSDVAPFPPYLDDQLGWDRALGSEPLRQPALRRVADGVSSELDSPYEADESLRIDRIRALGNAVIPLQAAWAFYDLSAQLLENRRG